MHSSKYYSVSLLGIFPETSGWILTMAVGHRTSNSVVLTTRMVLPSAAWAVRMLFLHSQSSRLKGSNSGCTTPCGLPLPLLTWTTFRIQQNRLFRSNSQIRQSGLPLLGQKYLAAQDRKSTRLNSSHPTISYAVFCL